MSKPRVLQVIRPVEGGMLVHLSRLVNGLSDDFAFTVACPPEVAEHMSGAGAEILPLWLSRGLSPGDLAAVARLARAVRGGAFKFVHAHGFKAALVARPAAKAGRIPCVVTVHGDFAAAALTRLGPLYLRAEKLLSRWTSGYITVSEWLAEELAVSFGVSRERLRTIPNGIPLTQDSGDFAGFPFAGGLPVVGTVARLAPQKGVADFVHAAARLSSRYPDLRFVVAGDGPERGRLEALAGLLGLDGRLFFVGHRNDVPALLLRLCVFVQPSLSEGQGITVLEAMAAGCPVVATAAGGLTELVKDNENGLLVSPGDAGALAKAIENLLLDQSLAAKLAARGQVTARAYSLDAMLDKTRQLYRTLLEGGWPSEKD